MENNNIAIGPSQKLGIDTPSEREEARESIDPAVAEVGGEHPQRQRERER